MNVLGIDGALGGFSAALAVEEKIVAGEHADGNVALERGLSIVATALEKARLAPARLDRIAIGLGPGGFTGLRIAISYAKALAQAWDLPLVGIDSFDLLEYGLALDPLLTVVHGRRGVISARYRRAATERRASGWIAEAIGEVLAGETPGPLAVAGAAEDVLGALAEAGFTVRQYTASTGPAAAAALLASSRAAAASLHEVRADYGELPAARVPKL